MNTNFLGREFFELKLVKHHMFYALLRNFMNTGSFLLVKEIDPLPQTPLI